MATVEGSSSIGDDGQIAEDNDADTHSGEYQARKLAAENNTAIDDAVNDDPTGGSREQVAAKQAANQMGDQDDVNAVSRYPAGSEVPTAQNVRRYPELFDQSVIDSFNESPVEQAEAGDSSNNIEDGESIAEAEGFSGSDGPTDSESVTQTVTSDDVPESGQLGDSTGFNQ